MSDIHQEWRELREKNGNFINHLDGEMAKIEKKQVELEHRKQLQNLADAGAFAIQFVAPPPFNCCQDDRDILKALNKAQADRIKQLEDKILAYKEQKQIDLAVKKDLDEKLDKATADYRALWVERDNLMETISRMEKTIRDLDERNGTLRERLANTNASLKRSVQRESGFQSRIDYLEHLRQCQAKEIERLREIVNAPNGSCSAYTQQGMQSKIAKQAAEIRRLTEENLKLRNTNIGLCGAQVKYDEIIAKLKEEVKSYGELVDKTAKDAEHARKAGYDEGYYFGVNELWKAIQVANIQMPNVLQDAYGYRCIDNVVSNLTGTAFLRKTEEFQTRISIGDEVEIFDQFCPDDDPHSDIGIVVMIHEPQTNCEPRCYTVVGPKFEADIDDTDIACGVARKTGEHYDSIPFNYLT